MFNGLELVSGNIHEGSDMDKQVLETQFMEKDIVNKILSGK